ncbi:MAG TPA: hypothetical protein VIW67_20765 [Terriglobales bacterium]|jgi:hypothetical protein
MSIAPIISISSEAPETVYSMERYRLVYRAAKESRRLAENIRYGGLFAACVLVVAALFVYQGLPSERFEKPIVSGLLVAVAVISATICQVWGSILTAQSQLLETAIDAAVHTSPFLTDDQRAAVMFFEGEAKKSGVEIRPKRHGAA